MSSNRPSSPSLGVRISNSFRLKKSPRSSSSDAGSATSNTADGDLSRGVSESSMSNRSSAVSSTKQTNMNKSSRRFSLLARFQSSGDANSAPWLPVASAAEICERHGIKPKLQGFLMVAIGASGGGGARKWKKRYVAVDDEGVFVFTHEDGRAQQKATLKLLFCFVRRKQQDDQHRFFSVYNKDRELSFAGLPDAQLDEWADQCERAADQRRLAELGGDDALDPRDISVELEANVGGADGGSAGSGGGRSGKSLATSGEMAVTAPAGSPLAQLTPLRAGTLMERTGRNKWKRRWVVLDDTALYVFAHAGDSKPERNHMQLLFCSGKAVPTPDKPFAFAVYAKDQTVTLSASSQPDLDEWLNAVQSVSERLMLNTLGQLVDGDGGDAGNAETSASRRSERGGGAERGGDGVVRRKAPRALQREVQALRELAQNWTCADCEATEPDWCVVNIGCFVCLECSGVHRNLGTHISKVRSTTLDMLLPEHIERLATWGNVRVNAEWEALLPDSVKRPGEKATRAEREAFIMAKYKLNKYRQRGADTDADEARNNDMTSTSSKTGVPTDADEVDIGFELPRSAADLEALADNEAFRDAVMFLLREDRAVKAAFDSSLELHEQRARQRRRHRKHRRKQRGGGGGGGECDDDDADESDS